MIAAVATSRDIVAAVRRVMVAFASSSAVRPSTINTKDEEAIVRVGRGFCCPFIYIS